MEFENLTTHLGAFRNQHSEKRDFSKFVLENNDSLTIHKNTTIAQNKHKKHN